MPGSLTLAWVGRTLGRFHGRPPRPVSLDPFRLILYEQVAYLVPESRRRAAFRRLRTEVGLTPEAILAAPAATLRAIARAGGATLPTRPAPLAELAAQLRRHGETVCRRSAPDCLACPLALHCRYDIEHRPRRS